MTEPMETREKPNPRTNSLLAKLDSEDYESLLTNCKPVQLKFRKRLFLQDASIDAVYFPLTCMVSLLVSTNGHPETEMATIGKEGVVGAAEASLRRGAFGLHLIQIGGTALRISSNNFLAEIKSRPSIATVLQQHQYALTRQILQGAACNRIHSMEERCARWILMTHDRAGQDSFPLTQEFLSHMLGVRRATVNVATGMLKKAGFVRYVRGQVTVTDRAGLESASCECYRVIRNIYASALLSPEK